MLEAVLGKTRPTVLGGTAGNVVYDGTVTPPWNRKGKDGNPPPTDARASVLPCTTPRIDLIVPL